MKHIPNGARPSKKAPESDFTGTVWQDAINDAPAPARVRVVKVRFEPGARTAWHTHPFGQTLYCIEGLGLARSEGGPLIELRPGDTIWIPPGEKHWHGASPTTSMTHIAVHETLDGKAADWMEKVSDAEYSAS
ncbi:MAG: cupin domain-containing protein [Rhizobiaceae bacterium]|nr:cupin domain-containing protein [Rhizobiaceae bacterium]